MACGWATARPMMWSILRALLLLSSSAITCIIQTIVKSQRGIWARAGRDQRLYSIQWSRGIEGE